MYYTKLRGTLPKNAPMTPKNGLFSVQLPTIRDTYIKHKGTAVICENSGSIIASYNVLLTQLDSKLVAQPIISYIVAKQPLTCSNCGKNRSCQKNLS
jgi:hypothetical protein